MSRKIKKALGLTILAIPGTIVILMLIVSLILVDVTRGLLWCLGLEEATLGSKRIDILVE